VTGFLDFVTTIGDTVLIFTPQITSTSSKWWTISAFLLSEAQPKNALALPPPPKNIPKWLIALTFHYHTQSHKKPYLCTYLCMYVVCVAKQIIGSNNAELCRYDNFHFHTTPAT
jgi:hypothetical protein